MSNKGFNPYANYDKNKSKPQPARPQHGGQRNQGGYGSPAGGNKISEMTRQMKQAKQPLSTYLKDADVYLPEGMAYQIAVELKDLNVNQLRKIFEMVKRASDLVRLNASQFDEAREMLFMTVPLVAYATGRDLIKPKDFNLFIQAAINHDTIKTKDDIIRFQKFMEAILAYSKERPQGGKS